MGRTNGNYYRLSPAHGNRAVTSYTTGARKRDTGVANWYWSVRAYRTMLTEWEARPVVYDLEGVLGPTVMQFVERHVRSLLAWDILVFFHRNPDAVLDAAGLASRLGRRVEEVEPEIDALCDGRILQCAGGLIRYRPSPELRDDVAGFVEACQDRGRRLALIALVLHRIGKSPGEA